uniref:P-loop containing nucleoside triphosphate hydrolase protein n=1 Tax=Kwoniella pini CBS 10737 TaxID=1296096 RepID=A0A1B9HZ11_9TREE|nr:uncharacterized protein I206_05257 [Kwoniella pini CBS 10737]OCF48478.1 hypothetical protein I206_05257 [Kwoniella pini CBS 10737]
MSDSGDEDPLWAVEEDIQAIDVDSSFNADDSPSPVNRLPAASKVMRDSYPLATRLKSLSPKLNEILEISAPDDVGALPESVAGSTSATVEKINNNAMQISDISDKLNNDDTEITVTPEILKEREIALPSVRLIPTSRLTAAQQKCFKFPVFNEVQSAVFQDVYLGTENVVVAAPTGSGKTTIFELAFLKTRNAVSTGTKPLAIYIAPTKALCSEKRRDWEIRLESNLNVRCCEITGDTGRFDVVTGLIKDADLIIITPEKLDSITRRQSWANKKFYNRIGLIMLDEVHILHETRGATLEVVMSRITQKAPNVRVIALSATVPNIDDVARWIGRRESQMAMAKIYKFGEEFRPVPLKKHVYGIDGGGNEWSLAPRLDANLFPLLLKHAEGKPVLIFCPTRKACQTTAAFIQKTYLNAHAEGQALPWSSKRNVQLDLKDNKIKEFTNQGIAVHHAGLDYSDRRDIEDGFISGKIHLIVSTSTLAVGVNLPAHTVIIKGTMAWHGPVLGFQEYSDIEIQQMMGRAGRPQFDKSGTVVVMCEKTNVQKVSYLTRIETLLESTHDFLATVDLNNEISLKTIQTLSSALEWLRRQVTIFRPRSRYCRSFFYIRIQQNPSHYSLQEAFEKTIDSSWEEYLNQCIEVSRDGVAHKPGEFDLQTTDEGHTMRNCMIGEYHMLTRYSRIMLRPITNRIFNEAPSSHRYKDLRIRPGEAKMLNNLSKEGKVRFTVKEGAKTYGDKVFLLMQVQFGSYILDTEKKTESTSFLQTQIIIFSHAERIAKGTIAGAISILKIALSRKYGNTTKAALELHRTIAGKAWEDSSSMFRQLDQVGEMKLNIASILTANLYFDQLLAKDILQLDAFHKRGLTFWRTVREQAQKMPRFIVTIQAIRSERIEDSTDKSHKVLVLNIDVRSLGRDLLQVDGFRKRKFKSSSWFFSALLLRDDGGYIHYTRTSLETIIKAKSPSLTVKVELKSRFKTIIGTFGEEVSGCTETVNFDLNLDDSVWPETVTAAAEQQADLDPLSGTVVPIEDDASIRLDADSSVEILDATKEIEDDTLTNRPTGTCDRQSQLSPAPSVSLPPQAQSATDPHSDDIFETIPVHWEESNVRKMQLDRPRIANDASCDYIEKGSGLIDWDVNEMFEGVDIVADPPLSPPLVAGEKQSTSCNRVDKFLAVTANGSRLHHRSSERPGALHDAPSVQTAEHQDHDYNASLPPQKRVRLDYDRSFHREESV